MLCRGPLSTHTAPGPLCTHTALHAMDIRVRFDEYRASGDTEPLDIMNSRWLDWRRFAGQKQMTPGEIASVETAVLAYDKSVRDPNRPGFHRLEIKLSSRDTIFRLYPGA